MSSPLDRQCLAIFEAATSCNIGLRVRTNNSVKCRAALWKFRKDFNNPEFVPFQIRISPDDTEHEIWLIRQGLGVAIGSLDVI